MGEIQGSVRGIDHPYYGAEGEATRFDSVNDLIEHANSYDEDLNFVYRWDWEVPDEDMIEAYKEDGLEEPSETLTLFVVLQRKARIINWVATVTAADEPKVREFLAGDRVLGALGRTWEPLLPAAAAPDAVAVRDVPSGARVHELKTWPVWFADLASRSKGFEVRRDDRGFENGDWLVLREWSPGDVGLSRDPAPEGYTGRRLIRRIQYVLRGWAATEVGVQEGFCVLGLAPSEEDRRG